MSKQFPECPLYNHVNCKEVDNRKICAIVREDKKCLKKLHKNSKEAWKITHNREVADGLIIKTPFLIEVGFCFFINVLD